LKEQEKLKKLRLKTLFDAEHQREEVREALYQMSVWNSWDTNIVKSLVVPLDSSNFQRTTRCTTVETLVRKSAAFSRAQERLRMEDQSMRNSVSLSKHNPTAKNKLSLKSLNYHSQSQSSFKDRIKSSKSSNGSKAEALPTQLSKREMTAPISPIKETFESREEYKTMSPKRVENPVFEVRVEPKHSKEERKPIHSKEEIKPVYSKQATEPKIEKIEPTSFKHEHESLNSNKEIEPIQKIHIKNKESDSILKSKIEGIDNAFSFEDNEGTQQYEPKLTLFTDVKGLTTEEGLENNLHNNQEDSGLHQSGDQEDNYEFEAFVSDSEEQNKKKEEKDDESARDHDGNNNNEESREGNNEEINRRERKVSNIKLEEQEVSGDTEYLNGDSKDDFENTE